MCDDDHQINNNNSYRIGMNNLFQSVLVAIVAVLATLIATRHPATRLVSTAHLYGQSPSVAEKGAVSVAADVCAICAETATAGGDASDAAKGWDFIVVGGGTAGCVVAAKLAAAPERWSVLVIERGEEVSDEQYIQPPSWNAVFEPILSDPVGFPVEAHAVMIPSKYSGWTPEYVPRVMGGGPQISGSFWGRGDPKGYNEWSVMVGDESWNYTNLLPLFTEIEHVEFPFNPDTPIHPSRGRSGPLKVAGLKHDDPRIKPFADALADTLGLPRCLDYNTPNGTACVAALQRTFGHDGSKPYRSSTWSGFLQPIVEQSNVAVHVQSTVSRIRFEPDTKRAYAVEYNKHGVSACACLADPSGQLIMSAGSFGNPKLFKLSGVGPKREIERHRIPLVMDLPGVGENLQYHFSVPFIYMLNRTQYPTGRDPSDNGYGADVVTEAHTTDDTNDVHCRVRPPPTPDSVLAQDSVPHIAFFQTSISKESNDTGGPDMEVLFALTDRSNSMTLAGSMIALHNEARGSVHLLNTDTYAAPIIGHHWPSTEAWQRDEKRFSEALSKLRTAWTTLVTTTAAASTSEKAGGGVKPTAVVTEMLPGFGMAPRDNCTLNHIGAVLSQYMFAYHHPAGTCKMGNPQAGDRMAVVDSQLKVVGMPNVYVADNSIMPRVVAQHPSGTASVIGLKLANQLIKQARERATLAAAATQSATRKP